MSHSEILLDIEHVGTPSTIEGLRLAVPNLWSPPLKPVERMFNNSLKYLQSENKADI